MLSSLGLVVAREIPASLLPGLISRAYSVHGGVIRDGVGRIVCHLVTGGATSTLASLIPGAGLVGSVVNAGQIYAVGRDVKAVQKTVNTVLDVTKANAALIQQVQESVGSVLSVSMANTALSGLGLVTSVAGFAYLSHRLNQVDAKLAQLEKQIKELRHLIQSQQKAQLHTAIDCLRQSELTTDDRLRHELLMQSKSNFTTLAHYYKELWSNASEIHEVDGVDEYFTLAFTGAALATSELGMADVAYSELSRHYDDWKALARRHCSTQMLREDPQRLMKASWVKDLPTRELIETLDFVHDTQRGIDWIDELRGQTTSMADKARSSIPRPFQRFVTVTDEKPGIDFARRLRARDDVLNTNVVHFDFLRDKKISANHFANEVKGVLSQNGDVPICIYKA